MITPNGILSYLYQRLPSLTDRFNQDLPVASARIESGNVVLAVPGHSVVPGQDLVVAGGELQNPIIAATDNGDGTYRLETQFNHQLTEPRQPLDPTTLQVGATTYEIEAVPNRRTFEVEAPAGTIFVGQALVERLYNTIGYLPVVSVSGDELTLQPPAGPELYNTALPGLRASAKLRIAVADSIGRATTMYTSDGPQRPFLFIIMGDTDVSKDRHTQSDAIAAFTAQDLRRLTLLQNFSVAVFLPTVDDIGSARAQEAAYGEIYLALTQAFYGYGFKERDSALQYVTVSAGHGPGPVNTAYYVHVYDWQCPATLTFESGAVIDDSVAFRDIDFTLDRDGAVLFANVDLDKEPL
ncbi:hypothetical protein [Lysobacter sp. GCM10012299]|uniref:hypothetical protein n=1 Tax=Lysobacter sp. GCM10012299 TaxID=3317333 RepID=UPI00361C7A67